MVALHITITNLGGDRFHVNSDNLRREDANPKEIAMANLLEKTMQLAINALADKVLKSEISQSGPGAADSAEAPRG